MNDESKRSIFVGAHIKIKGSLFKIKSAGKHQIILVKVATPDSSKLVKSYNVIGHKYTILKPGDTIAIGDSKFIVSSATKTQLRLKRDGKVEEIN